MSEETSAVLSAAVSDTAVWQTAPSVSCTQLLERVESDLSRWFLFQLRHQPRDHIPAFREVALLLSCQTVRCLLHLLPHHLYQNRLVGYSTVDSQMRTKSIVGHW